jgi:PAS domain S-box-containing protein
LNTSDRLPNEEPAETVSQAGDDRFRTLVSQIKDYAIFMLDTEGRVASWNEGAERIKGYEQDEILGESISRFYTAEDRERGHPAALLALAQKEGRVEDEGWRVRKDGTRFWADVVITALRDDQGTLQGFAKVTRDLTERRETELALAGLSGRLLEMQDNERRRIARELHDNTSPLLTGLMSRLHAAKQRVRGDATLLAILDDAIANADATSSAVRSVAALLHPPLLDESGLLASLRWYVKQLSNSKELKIDVDFPASLERLPRDAEIALFRTVQESFSSIFQHAGGKKSSLRIGVKGRVLTLSIEGDDLAGVSMSDIRSSRSDIGIAVAGMRERIRKLGGTLNLANERGTVSVVVSLPLDALPQRTGGGQA